MHPTGHLWLLSVPSSGEAEHTQSGLPCGHSVALLVSHLLPSHHRAMELGPLSLWLFALSSCLSTTKEVLRTGWKPLGKTSKSGFGVSVPAGTGVGTACFYIAPNRV